MIKVKELRVINLKALIRKHQTQKNLSIAIDMATTQISGILNNVRSMGEKRARKIEDKLSLPDGWMDQDHTVNEPLLNDVIRKLKQVHPDSLPIILGAIENSPKRNQ